MVTATTVECSFSQMRIVKTRFRNRLRDIKLARLMHIVIERPELTSILDVFKEQNHRLALNSVYYYWPICHRYM